MSILQWVTNISEMGVEHQTRNIMQFNIYVMADLSEQITQSGFSYENIVFKRPQLKLKKYLLD